MEILAFLVTIFVGYLADALIGFRWNWPDAGSIFAIATIGSFLLWAVRHPKHKE